MFSDDLLGFIMENEGFNAVPYKCTAGRLTVGYGHNLHNPLSLKTARAILKDDIGVAVSNLYRLFPAFLSFPEGPKMALIDMMFNLGLSRFLGFKRMIEAIYKGDWAMAGVEAQDSKWYGQVGVRGDKIVKLLTEGE